MPGYYTPDRVCRLYQEKANADYPWASKRGLAFARFTHFCKRVKRQEDVYGRPLPPCARSYFAHLAQHDPAGRARLDVAPLNVANETWDPSLDYGRQLRVLAPDPGSSTPDPGS